ncbi:flagellar basal body rod protein FlgB [uncultured Nevskia sp.]|uniref:flagellar basal body rod protein FlgB n=1 Tax=uncultured Nevskia sp. TaxID=228950 RepID=UPI0025EE7597|nr:flagellar basal body rod protein FlgB [uncultured Nevskia sp.]
MANLDPIFGIHAEAMSVQRKRMEVLSANIANADTPGFQARDVDFASTLASVIKSDSLGASRTLTTDARHIPMNLNLAGDGSRLAYRVPMQPSVDGNTVDVQVEQAKFAEAALHYQASLQFADGRIRGLMTAITGQ